MRVERRRNYRDWNKILRVVEEVVPSEDFVLHDVIKLIDGSYKAIAEDSEYHYEVLFKLELSEEGFYRLLDFVWEEKPCGKSWQKK